MKWRAAKIERALLALDEDERNAVLYNVLHSIDKTATFEQSIDQTVRNQLLRKLQNNQQSALLDALEEHAQLRSDMSALRQWR
jgi:Mg/Co/Ni transporter MgtE